MHWIAAVSYLLMISTPARSDQQCEDVSHVQRAVIQIMNNHYEYGKGIHRLHEQMDRVQQEGVSVKEDADKRYRTIKKMVKRKEEEMKKQMEINARLERRILALEQKLSAMHEERIVYTGEDLNKMLFTNYNGLRKTTTDLARQKCVALSVAQSMT